MKSVEIKNIGESSTSIIVDVTDQEYTFLCNIATKLNETAAYNNAPKLRIYG